MLACIFGKRAHACNALAAFDSQPSPASAPTTGGLRLSKAEQAFYLLMCLSS